MNKADLVRHVAEEADISAASAARTVDAMLGAISAALRSGETVALAGFGTFASRERAARTVRNPRTGAAIEVPASRAAVFRPGKALKESLN
ncbi:MAG: HU family DNA-binding protein [Ectothiorhodospiraceae bacterium]|nr:HU family DNA-binding protein [Chromatiales bacterium]MCP5157401.1 HU family DNA-binding protein [Ectothiorhodospiraceae bacterium]